MSHTMKDIVSEIRSRKLIEPRTMPAPLSAAVLIRSFRVLMICVLAVGMSSCLPLLAGVAVGYVAHSEGVGIAPPLNSGRTYEAPAQEYDAGGYDEPVY
jgi:hypothetical protein